MTAKAYECHVIPKADVKSNKSIHYGYSLKSASRPPALRRGGLCRMRSAGLRRGTDRRKRKKRHSLYT